MCSCIRTLTIKKLNINNVLSLIDPFANSVGVISRFQLVGL